MNEQFEKWYCETYWDFKAVENRQVFFNNGKYNHFDVDLAWNAFVSGYDTATNDVKFLSHRAMFDSGCDHGRKETATEIMQYIADRLYEGCIIGAAAGIKEKFRLEI
jgi:hypothetical protein